MLMHKHHGQYTHATMLRQEVFETSTETLAFREYIRETYPPYFGLHEHGYGSTPMRHYNT